MILTCPACATRYLVDPSAIGPEGRRVRCARCSHTWAQPGTAPPPRKSAELPIQRMAPTDRPRPIPAGSNLPALRQERRSNWAGWTALAITLAGLGIAVVGGRERVVALWPPAKPFYQAIGLWAEPNIEVARVTKAGNPPDGAKDAVILEIEVVNRGNAPGLVPKLAVALRDDKNRDLVAWAVTPDEVPLKPGEARVIRTRGNVVPGAQAIAVTPVPR